MRLLRALLVATWSVGAASVFASDHRDAPIISLDTRADLADLYVFRAPADPSRMVFIVTMNHAAGIVSPDTFTPGIAYNVEIYNDDDFKPDVLFTVKFGKPENGLQGLKIKSKGGRDVFQAAGLVGAELDLGSGGRFRSGLFDDPFFFDAVGFHNGTLAPTGRDFYAGTNVNAFVIEVPTAALLRLPQTIIATRAFAKKGASDAVGRPLVSRFFLGEAHIRDLFNKAKLAKQDVFLASIAATLAPHYDPTQAALVADFLIPDVLPVDTAQPTGFFNGRKLDDDVADAMLGQLTNGAITSDGVPANDRSFTTVFPYLAAPH